MGREDQSDRRERHLTSRKTSVPKIPTTGSFVGDRRAERWVRGSLPCTNARSEHATNTKEAVGIGCCAHGFAADRAEIRLRRIERFGAEPRHERNRLTVVFDSEGLERLAQAQTELGEVPRVRDERGDRRVHTSPTAPSAASPISTSVASLGSSGRAGGSSVGYDSSGCLASGVTVSGGRVEILPCVDGAQS
jgi:hypothetical protein